MLAKAMCQFAVMLDVPTSSRASLLPQGSAAYMHFVAAEHLCGSEPAREDDVTVDEDVGCAGLIASKLAPTKGICGVHELCGC